MRSQLAGKPRHRREQVPHEADIRDMEDRGVFVLVDCNDGLGPFDREEVAAGWSQGMFIIALAFRWVPTGRRLLPQEIRGGEGGSEPHCRSVSSPRQNRQKRLNCALLGLR